MLGSRPVDASPAARARAVPVRRGRRRAGRRLAAPWPYGALLPWALSRVHWHAWASQMPAALAGSGRRDPARPRGRRRGLLHAAAARLRRPGQRLAADAVRPHPDRLRRRLAPAVPARGRARRPAPGLRRLAGVAAAWYFGANASGAPMYDPATGVTFDGVAADGTVNHNSGAESTIHGLLSMLALDGAPDVARWARRAAVVVADARGRVVEAESVGGPVVTPPSAWTRRVGVERRRVRRAAGRWEVKFGPRARHRRGGGADGPGRGRDVLGSARHALARRRRSAGLLAGARPARDPAPRRSAATSPPAGVSGTVALDAIQVTPPSSRSSSAARGHSQALLRSFATVPRRARVPFAGIASAYDARGRLVARTRAARVRIPPGGFAIAER